MGVTSDIGQDRIDIYVDVCEERGIAETDAYWSGFDWCYPHDNNTLCNWCSCCPEGNEPIEKFRERVERWFDEGTY